MQRKRFFVKNFISVIIPTLISISLVGIISIIIIYQYMHSDIKKNNVNLLSLVKINLEFMLTDLEQYTLNFSANPDIIARAKEILSSNIYTYEMSENIKFIQNSINTPVNAHKYLHSAYVYYKHYDKFFATDFGAVALDKFYDRDWVDSVKNENGRGQIWIESREIRQFDFEKHPTKVISVYRNFFSPGARTSDGIITINFRQDYVNNMLSDLLIYNQQSILVANSEGTVLFSSSGDNTLEAGNLEDIRLNASNAFTEIIGNTPYLVFKTYSDKYGLYFISILPFTAVSSVMKELLLGTISVISVAIIIGSLFAYAMTNKSRRQITTIISILEQYETSREFPKVLPEATDEYDYIVRNILKTFIENDQINTQLTKRKYLLELYELKALQMQLNPHFLYNTLETINWKSMELYGKPGLVNSMIENLSSILKCCLTSAEERVTISKEIEYTKCYISIQNVRYGNKFHVIWEYDEEVLDYKILKLFFQPLLENCISHGVILRESEGLIKIKIMLKKERIKITIIDNGVGMDREKLKEVRESLENQWQDTKHIGLINTNQRIRLLYGGKYCIRINSKKDLGTVQYLEIPKDDQTVPM